MLATGFNRGGLGQELYRAVGMKKRQPYRCINNSKGLRQRRRKVLLCFYYFSPGRTTGVHQDLNIELNLIKLFGLSFISTEINEGDTA